MHQSTQVNPIRFSENLGLRILGFIDNEIIPTLFW